MSAVTSPDISNLDFTVLFDISGATPAITLTNASTVINPTALKWWYVITTPSNTPVHTGSLATPDVSNTPWTTLAITPGTWPQIFGRGACAQIEFSCNAPYTVTLYVIDSDDNTFSLTKTATICRPTGNTANSCGNFGVASLSIKTDCQNARLICQDNTNFSYQNQVSAYSNASTWTLVYPQSPSGSQPSNGTASNTPTVLFPLSYGGEGFNIYIRDYATYSMGDGVYIKLQYKAQETFNVWCNIDLCQLQCEMQRFFTEATTDCGEIETIGANKKMAQVNYLYSKILTGILQPLCNIDVPATIVEMEALFGFESTCCCNGGVNMSTAPVFPTADCCTSSVIILDIATGLKPANCPNGYFPVQVYDPTWTTVIGVATDVDNLVAILNGNAAWLVYGVAINAGNCNVGFILADTSVTVPAVKVATPSTDCTGDTQFYSVPLTDLCVADTVVNAADFPLNAFVDFGLGDGDVSLGNITSVANLIIALNDEATKPATITFSDGSASTSNPPVVINIYNSSCEAYSGTITITCDRGSSAFMAFGASHFNMTDTPAPINGGEVGYGMRTNVEIGVIPGLDSSNIQWHSIKIGNTLVVSESNTGKIYFWDITNPLVPIFIRYIQLDDVSGTCFTGQPQTGGLGGGLIDSYSTLYFPTDYSNMSLNEIYVFEAITGSAWKINMYDTGTGVTASFRNNGLLGCVPRVIINSRIFFTTDGNTPSFVLGAGFIQTLSLPGSGSFDATNLLPQEIIGASYDRVWAASYDGVGSIYFMGLNGTLAQYDVATDTVTAITVDAMGPGQNFELRGNIKYYLKKIYASSFGGFKPLGVSSGALVIDMASYPTSTTATLFDTYSGTDGTAQYVHNILPLGNCLVLVTGEGYQDTYFSTERGAIAIYRTSGQFLTYLELEEGQNIYNLVTIPGISVYSPTTLV